LFPPSTTWFSIEKIFIARIFFFNTSADRTLGRVMPFSIHTYLFFFRRTGPKIKIPQISLRDEIYYSHGSKDKERTDKNKWIDRSFCLIHIIPPSYNGPQRINTLIDLSYFPNPTMRRSIDNIAAIQNKTDLPQIENK